jgi:hypothetical protein
VRFPFPPNSLFLFSNELYQKKLKGRAS